MAGFMMAWSVVSLLTYLAHDFKSMLLARLFLGITEAPVRFLPTPMPLNVLISP